MPHASKPNGPEQQRSALVRDAILGFLGFLALMSMVQAAINLLQPSPALWPALLALVLVCTVVALWRRWRQ